MVISEDTPIAKRFTMDLSLTVLQLSSVAAGMRGERSNPLRYRHGYDSEDNTCVAIIYNIASPWTYAGLLLPRYFNIL